MSRKASHERRQLTIRFDDDLDRRLRDVARGEGISLNQAAVRLLRRATGLTHPPPVRVVGDALDRFIGTWSARTARAVAEAAEDFEQIDVSLWR